MLFFQCFYSLLATVFKGRVSEVYSYWLQTCFELIWILSTSFFICWEIGFMQKFLHRFHKLFQMCHCIIVKVDLLARTLHLILSFKSLRKYPQHPSPPPPPKKNDGDVYVHVLQLNLRRNLSLKFVWNLLRFLRC